jgi:hypothetical protein
LTTPAPTNEQYTQLLTEGKATINGREVSLQTKEYLAFNGPCVNEALVMEVIGLKIAPNKVVIPGTPGKPGTTVEGSVLMDIGLATGSQWSQKITVGVAAGADQQNGF